MEDDSLDKALQYAILSLLDIKPKDPIKFLAAHFQMECETNLVAKAVHILQDMTIYHPAMEERLLKAYATICQYNEDEGLTGDIYTDLLVKLVADSPAYQRENFLQHLQCQSTEYVSFDVFRSGVLTLILFNQFVFEVKLLFSKICVENHDSAPTFLCKKALRKMSKCLSEAAKKTLNEMDSSCTLGISELSSPVRKTLTKNLPTADYVKLNTFLSEAVEIFLREVPKIKFKTSDVHLACLDLLNLSDKQTENPNSCNYQAGIKFRLFGDNFHIPVAFSNGNCRSLEEFKKEKCISSGLLDHFYQCQDLIKKRPVTLVRYVILNPLNLDLKDLLHELEIVRNLKHHHILQYYETAVTQLTNVYFVYEPCACFLSNLMWDGIEKLFQLPVIKNIMLQLFEALNYMHEHSIMHRNIQPKNIAITSTGCLKVCNFRNARWLWDQEPYVYTDESRGQSPELLMRTKICSTPVDIWAAACILVELLLERPFISATRPNIILPEVFSIFGFPTKESWPDFFKIPECDFFDENKQEVHSYNCLNLYFKKAECPQNQNTMDLLQWMFCLDPKNRPSANQCADHIFFVEEPTACKMDELVDCVNIFLSGQTAQEFQTKEMSNKKV